MSGALQAVFQNQRSFGPQYMDVSTTGSPTITTDGNFKVVKFTGAGEFIVNTVGTDPTYGAAVDYLIIAGGASGGRGSGAGGGAGGVIDSTGVAVTATTYTITIGSGGARQTTNSRRGNAGLDTTAFSQTAVGGGGGGGGYNVAGQGNGGSGGSGGGAAYSSGGGSGTAGQGSDGGIWDDDPKAGQLALGGGGGAGGAGQKGVNKQTGGVGGIGRSVLITGTATYYGGGGGGSGSGASGAGGLGGGGAGNTAILTQATSGTVNTGGGGGGNIQQENSGAGGSGLVIVRYKFQ
jgi:hypothetical protein